VKRSLRAVAKEFRPERSASTQPALERGLIEFRYITKERSAT